jgi:tetratricopeptide (TPR) repeat protein
MKTIALVLALLASEHIRSAEQAFRSGKTAIAERNWHVAEKSFLKAIDIEPTYLDAYRSLVDVYMETNRPTEAGAILTRLLQIEPNSVDYRLRLGRLLISGQQWARALAQFSIARRLAPQNPDALYGFALAASKNGMTAVAVDALKRGRAQFPDDRRIMTLLDQIDADAPVPSPQK